jgi:hypothetical protein
MAKNARSAALVGNTNACGNKPWLDALKRAMIRYDGGKLNALNLIADQTVKLAVSGESWAIKEIADRCDGKAAQSVTVSGDSEKPLVHRIERVIIDHAKDPDA